MNYYIIFDENGEFIFLSTSPSAMITTCVENEEGNTQEVITEDLPVGAISITEEQQALYLAALFDGVQYIKLINNEIILVDKYTIEEPAVKQAAKVKQLAISQAKALLSASDYKVLPDKFAEYTTEQQTELVAYRAQLRLVARGESTELPTISF